MKRHVEFKPPTESEPNIKADLLNALGESVNAANNITIRSLKSEIIKLQNKVLSDAAYIRALEEGVKIAKLAIKQRDLITALETVKP